MKSKLVLERSAGVMGDSVPLEGGRPRLKRELLLDLPAAGRDVDELGKCDLAVETESDIEGAKELMLPLPTLLKSRSIRAPPF